MESFKSQSPQESTLKSTSHLQDNQTQITVSSSQSEFQKILISNRIGRSLLRDYDKTKRLTAKQRKQIVTLITEFLVNTEQEPTSHTFTSFAKEIVHCFPSEIEEIYFIREKGQRLKGSLYYKYHNTLANLRRDGVIKSKKNKTSTQDLIQVDCFFAKENCEAEWHWLKYNIEPFDEILNKWTCTFNKRLSDLRSNKDLDLVLENWPLYKQSFGYKLIEFDFNKIYPNKENNLFEKWSTNYPKLIALMSERIKDPESVDLLSKICRENYSHDICSTVLVFLLHSLLPPTARKVQRSIEGVKKISKPTICDSRNTFLIIACNASDLKCKIKEITEIYFSNKKKLQPIICAIGHNIFEISEFYVYFGNVFYKLENIVKSIDICFKTFHVLNLEFPAESKLVWAFIKKIFYEMSLASSERTSHLYSVINDFNNLQLEEF